MHANRIAEVDSEKLHTQPKISSVQSMQERHMSCFGVQNSIVMLRYLGTLAVHRSGKSIRWKQLSPTRHDELSGHDPGSA
jgi:hypothetical protein